MIRLTCRRLVLAIATVASACAARPNIPDRATGLLRDAPEGEAALLLVSGDRVLTAAVPIGRSALPPPVRVAIDAVAPDGDETFCGLEWGTRGPGYRIEKRYVQDGVEDVRSTLIREDGVVLERAHSLAIGDVPKEILAAAMQVGPDVRRVMIVSGPEQEEYWHCEVGDRIGRTYRVRVGLNGRIVEVRRRVLATVEI